MTRDLRLFVHAIAFAAFACLGAGETFAAPVIPGGAGFGLETPAGRGGEIFRVTTLEDSGDGSLRECVEASGPRYCIFEVSGAIRLEDDLEITAPNLTIAGQTAPEPGILIRGATVEISASDVLIQHVAIRVGDDKSGPPPGSRDAIKIRGENIGNVVIDHCSVSWALDENISISEDVKDVTISNSILSEPLHESIHPQGAHGLVALIDPSDEKSRVSLIGNLFAHGHGRNPWSSAAEFAFVNNVVYNARDAEMMLTNRHGIPSRSSIVGNMFLKGRDSLSGIKPVRLVGPGEFDAALLRGTKIYLADNDSEFSSDDPWSIVHNKSSFTRELLEAASVLAWPSDFEALPTDDDAVLDYVLLNAGTRPAERNEVDRRIVSDVRRGSGEIINCVADDGSKRCSKNAGGWPELDMNVRKLDVPDDPNGDDDGDGYTNLDEWLHLMASNVQGGPIAVPDEDVDRHRAPPEAPTLE